MRVVARRRYLVIAHVRLLRSFRLSDRISPHHLLKHCPKALLIVVVDVVPQLLNYQSDWSEPSKADLGQQPVECTFDARRPTAQL